ncbi:MAG: CHAD domain-containing protein [Myxococcales bacterium]|nr:CHAD domain-containing protein [Myxococcales bacterium]
MHIDPSLALLSRPPAEAVRCIALGFLDQASAADRRLDDPADTEALHDFRVALRRLRATLGAWTEVLAPEITSRDRKTLRKVLRSTSEGRDAEVMLQWIEGRRGELLPKHEAARRWFAKRLEARKKAAYAETRAQVRAGYQAMRADLESRLRHLTIEIDVLAPPPPPTSFGRALAAALQAQMMVLAERLSAVASLADAERLHAARIDAKRLRYLLEPVAEALEPARAFVRECKRLQDVLGEFQDASVLAEALLHAAGELVDESASRPPARRTADPRTAGLAELMRRNHQRAEALFATAREGWLEGDGLARLAERLDALAVALDGAPPVEIERKFLLQGVPPDMPAVEGHRIDQGYLPGAHLVERVRRIVTEHGERFVRTVKLGAGVERIEVEEETDAEVFAALWALTEGRRVEKTRYAVPEGELVWEIDVFADRELVLAEVELPSVDATFEWPEWLAGHVLREVSEDEHFTNWRLAR